MWIHICGWQIAGLRSLGALNVTGWHRWHAGRGWCSGQRWRSIWCSMSASDLWRITRTFAPQVCLVMTCCASLASKAAAHVVLMNHSWVSFYRSLHLFMPRKLNTPLLLFSDFSPRFHDQILRFLHCGAQNLAFGHFGHIQCNVHVGLFNPYPTSLPCHCCRHVETLQEISCSM